MVRQDFWKTVKENHKLIVVLFFVVLFCLGAGIFRDYGIAGDEIVNRNNGLLSFRYAFEGDRELLEYKDRFYGTAFEVFLVWLEKVFGLEDTRQIFFIRHLATFALFYLAVFFFYLLCKKHFHSWKTGLLGSLFLILSPRIFSHAFFNSKDLAFLSFFIISMYGLVSYLDKKTVARAAACAFACALLIDVRVMGIIVPGLTAIFFFADFMAAGNERKRKELLSFFVFLLFLFPLVIIFWPILWRDPLGNFINALKQMSSFPWGGTVLYFGKYVKATNLSWHYIPVWIIITTPLVYSLCFIVGVCSITGSFIKPSGEDRSVKRNNLIVLSVFFLPIAAVIVFRSVLYDGWRHMYFVYPAFLMISITGLVSVFRFVKSSFKGTLYKIVRAVLIFAVAAGLAPTLVFMVRNHPYQNVYFNMLTGSMEKAKENFEIDYWGLSYREALEYIARNDESENISVFVSSLPGSIGRIPALMLKAGDRGRFKFVDTPEKADYFVSNYRWYKGEYPYEDEVFSIKVDGAKIVVAYRL